MATSEARTGKKHERAARKKSAARKSARKKTAAKKTVRKAAKKKSSARPARKTARKPPKKTAKAGRRRAPRGAKIAKAQNLQVDGEVLDFIAAIDRYKLEHERPFPSWSEILYILKELGYRKTAG